MEIEMSGGGAFLFLIVFGCLASLVGIWLGERNEIKKTLADAKLQEAQNEAERLRQTAQGEVSRQTHVSHPQGAVKL